MVNKSLVSAINLGGIIQIIDGVSCSRVGCIETGCSFPHCVKIISEYSSIDDARKDYPALQIIYNEE